MKFKFLHCTWGRCRRVATRSFAWMCLALGLCALGGCAVRERVVGTFEEPGTVRHTHEVTTRTQPRISMVDWSAVLGSVRIQVRQTEITEYDIEAVTTQVEVIQKPVEAEPARNGVIVFDPLGDRVRQAAADQRAMDLIKSGKPAVRIRNIGVYTKRVKGETTKVTGHERKTKDVDGSNVQLSLVMGSSPTPLKGTTDSNGFAIIRVVAIDDYPAVLKLAPMEGQILAEWKGHQIPLMATTLNESVVTMIVDGAKVATLKVVGTPASPPRADIKIEVPEKDVPADSDVMVKVTVTNVGKGPFYRLAAKSTSSAPALNDLAFEFGMLKPGQTLTVSQTVHIPRSQAGGPVVMDLGWTELNHFQPDPSQAKLQILGLPRPFFKTEWVVKDDNSGASVGNSDGRIQKGEAIDLLITVHNTGAGTAKSVDLNLSGLEGEGITLSVGHANLGEIAPGGSQSCRLTFFTNKNATVKALTPTLRVRDQAMDVISDVPMVLPINEALQPKILEFRKMVYIGKQESAVHSGAGDDTTVLARAPAGTALSCTGQVGDWMRVALTDKETGWVNRSTLGPEPEVPTGPGRVVTILQKAPPLIAISKPGSMSVATSTPLELSGVIAGSCNITRVECTQNGNPVELPFTKGIGVVGAHPAGTEQPQIDSRQCQFSTLVNLVEGVNTLKISAWDAEGLRSDAVLSITYSRPSGKVFIVSIGINNYAHVPHLQYAAADAREVADLLQKQWHVPKENVTLLIDEQATRENIMDAIGEKLAQKADKDDTVIVYYSGHGAPQSDPQSPDHDGLAKYLLPVDARADRLFATALPMNGVGEMFRQIKSARLIFIADTCYSGAASGHFKAIVNQDGLLARLKDTGSGRIILTASTGAEVSMEDPGLQHGVFTYYLLEGLRGGADKSGNGEVTIAQLYAYVSAKVAEQTKQKQHPTIAGDQVGEILLGAPGHK